MNIYYDNELGLTKVGEFEIREADYSFNIFAVWCDLLTKKFYTASDSGCSCPIPFDDITSRADLTEHENGHSVIAAIREIDEPFESPDDLIARVMAI
ncbi:hypothetical protein E3T46_07860 [Cryobacterium sp. Hh11]|uniref:DUF7574 domain-containing protein n=1 Tax=Cryobacterium sp. Hh11 TaxID=2555868 RepID=UPI00106BAA3F|nr:hypothetical protein [Cryobacterium sp. Hh11]TFD51995.1 hypothetical protein E3T46_07860 [Cryobacterium sp. Hh11]